MRAFAAICAIAVVTACHRSDDAPLRRSDGSLLSDAGGEVSLSDGSRLQFVITSERYKQWDAARGGLGKSVVARFGSLLRPKSPTQASIDRATAYLQSDPQSRQAIERTGMSVRDFVLMTVALEQEMQLAGSRGGTPADEAYPVDTAYELPTVPPAMIPPAETSYTPNTSYTPYTPPAYDGAPRPDTVVTRPRPRDSTFRRDTFPRRVDTLRRDSVARPLRADSTQDTTKSLPDSSTVR